MYEIVSIDDSEDSVSACQDLSRDGNATTNVQNPSSAEQRVLAEAILNGEARPTAFEAVIDEIQANNSQFYDELFAFFSDF